MHRCPLCKVKSLKEVVDARASKRAFLCPDCGQVYQAPKADYSAALIIGLAIAAAIYYRADLVRIYHETFPSTPPARTSR